MEEQISTWDELNIKDLLVANSIVLEQILFAKIL